ncbi:hypothetical protein B0H10DRAFT_2216539 [Mycena sp. CBHHK59/15]|nr:hypothetical protein B0H10DRAFT_2216539 [Mycena sp. CBHHK59/15]
MSRPLKNIWVAAADGDLVRVRQLVEDECNIVSECPRRIHIHPDVVSLLVLPAVVTLHQACRASYGQLQILEYLISRGGDVNVQDGDGDTPIYTVENVETAQFLVNHGATLDMRNAEGVSPIGHLREDFDQVASYLQSVVTPSSVPAPDALPQQQLSQHQQDIASEQLTSTLMTSVEDIMQRAEAEGRDPEEELRQVVGRTVLEGMVAGYQMSAVVQDDRHAEINGAPTKKAKTDDGLG